MINIPNSSTIDYRIFIKGKINKIQKELIKKITRLTLKQEKIQNNNLTLDFIICNTYEMSVFAKKYLNQDRATDIISIKNEDDIQAIHNERTILGTIILCPQIIKQNSINKNQTHHFCHLIIHGTLHLLGYNHENKEDITKMQNKEIHILSKLSISSPY